MRDLKKTIKKWAEQVSYKKAVGRLVGGGVSSRAAERLCAGDYKSEPKSLRKVLLEILAEDGF